MDNKNGIISGAEPATESPDDFSSWTARFEEHERTNLSIKDYCYINDIPESKYYYWLKKLRRIDLESSINEKFVEIAPETMKISDEPSPNAPVPPASISPANLTITVNDLCLKIQGSISEDALIPVLRAMKNA